MIYVVGEQTGLGGSGYVASQRIAELIGVDRGVFMHAIVWVNLFDSAASDPAKYIAMIDRASSPEDAIVLLGRAVAKEYGMESLGPLAAVRRHGGMGATVVAFPAPSSVNRWWTKSTNVALAADVLKRVWSDHR